MKGCGGGGGGGGGGGRRGDGRRGGGAIVNVPNQIVSLYSVPARRTDPIKAPTKQIIGRLLLLHYHYSNVVSVIVTAGVCVTQCGH